MDKFTREQRSKIMSAIKSKSTKDEVLLSKSLWLKGYRYRKNNRKVFGSPDLTFSRLKIAIFVDGEFFHGFNWDERKLKILSNRNYWIPKIEKNIKRDKLVNETLLSEGWIVLRFWGSFVRNNLSDCIAIIENEIMSKENQLKKPTLTNVG